MEKAVRSGSLIRSEAAFELDKLLSETARRFLDAPGIESDQAYRWFISEISKVCEELNYMRDKCNNTISTIAKSHTRRASSFKALHH
jgi:hypothetical protein